MKPGSSMPHSQGVSNNPYPELNCAHFTYSLRTDSYVSCREYCRQFEMNTARYFKYRKQKLNPTYSLRFYFYLLYLGGFLIYFVSCQTNLRGQTFPKV